MMTSQLIRQRRPAMRAAAAVLTTAVLSDVIWHLRPPSTVSSGSADADVVLACAWLVWALAGYLAVAVGGAATAHLVHLAGVRTGGLNLLVPTGLRRMVDTSITLGIAASILGTSGVSVAGAASPSTPSRSATTHLSDRAIPAADLDWPGLAPAPAVPLPAGHLQRQHRPPSDGGLLGGRSTVPSAGQEVVVHAGDTLWSIAARQLGPTASTASITAAWRAWYSANRGVIGPDPGLILPGQRLAAPSDRALTAVAIPPSAHESSAP